MRRTSGSTRRPRHQVARREDREHHVPARRLKAWRFGAKTERMNAEQREIFEETFAADQAEPGGSARRPAEQCPERIPRR